MKRIISLILVLGLVAFVGHVKSDDHHGHRTPPRVESKKTPKEPKAKKAHEPPRPEDAGARWEELKIRTIVGRVSATEERARADARRQLEAEVSQWLEPEVPPSWRPDPRRLDAMIVDIKITPTEKPYGTVHTAKLHVDFSDSVRAELVRAHDRVVVRDRLMKLGGLLAFLLICLAAVSAYIRADEATKGYHTTRLRLMTAAGVGAAGVLIYQLLA